MQNPAHRIPDGTIVRRFEIDKPYSFKELLERSKRQQTNGYGVRKDFDDSTLKNVPNSITKGEVEIHFVPTSKIIPPTELDAELDKLGYRLVDPTTLLAFNNYDEGFANKFPHATQWKCQDGRFFCLAFDGNPISKNRLVLDEVILSWAAGWYLGCVLH